MTTYDTLTYDLRQMVEQVLADSPGCNKPLLQRDCEAVLWNMLAPAKPDTQRWAASIIREEIAKHIPSITWPTSPTDVYFYVPTMAWVQDVFTSCPVGLTPYVSDLNDCENYAEDFRMYLRRCGVTSCALVTGYAPDPLQVSVGMTYHAWNIIVCSDGVLVAEPLHSGKHQLGWCNPLPSGLPGYLADTVVLL